MLLHSCNSAVPGAKQSTNTDSFKEPVLFIGQDLNSIAGYKACQSCPKVDGYTTYLNLALLRKQDFYGALGYTKKRKSYPETIDWGGGPLNAYQLAAQNPNSAIQIGLYLVDALDKVNDGRLDKEIQQLASFFQEFPKTQFYLRIGYEFDGYWNHYERRSYIKAFQTIVTYLRNEGVSNVQFVWQSCTSPVDDILDGGKENMMQYYPGDDYVDWFGLSWFLHPDIGPQGSTQKELALELVNLAKEHGKPVMICESANQGFDNSKLTKANISTILDGPSGQNQLKKSADDIWNEWYQPFFTFVADHSETIQAISYINANWDEQDLWNVPYEQGYWGDSRVEVNDTIRIRWTQAVEHYRGLVD